MTTPTRVMLLIDADNVSTDVIEQAISRLHAEYGALHVRRAYGTAEAAVKHQRLFKRLSIRPMVNLAAGKNSTDIALAVDAIDLVIAERPDVVVIASSDSDFAPLVSRIREKGCLVRGVGQKGKVGEETPLIYDDFIEFEHRASRSRGAAAGKGAADASGAPAAAPVGAAAGRARKTAARKAAPAARAGRAAEMQASPAVIEAPDGAAAASAPPAKAPRKTAARKKAAAPVAEAAAAAEAPAASKAPAKKRSTRASPASATQEALPFADIPPLPAPAKKAARKTAARKSATAAAPAPHPLPEKVARAFEVLPQLAAGQRMDVQNAAAVLRKERVFSNADSWPKFFERFKDWFELTPAERPTHVQRRQSAR